MVILADTERAAAAAIAERLRLAVQARGLAHRYSHRGQVTISIGVAACAPNRSTVADDLIAPADVALYSAKRLGRNLIWLAPEPENTGLPEPFVSDVVAEQGLRTH